MFVAAIAQTTISLVLETMNREDQGKPNFRVQELAWSGVVRTFI